MKYINVYLSASMNACDYGDLAIGGGGSTYVCREFAWRGSVRFY